MKKIIKANYFGDIIDIYMDFELTDLPVEGFAKYGEYHIEFEYEVNKEYVTVDSNLIYITPQPLDNGELVEAFIDTLRTECEDNGYKLDVI